MALTQCLECGGVYEPTPANAPRYFHACPPIRDPDAPAPAEGEVDTRPFVKRPCFRDENVPEDLPEPRGRGKRNGRGTRPVPDRNGLPLPPLPARPCRDETEL